MRLSELFGVARDALWAHKLQSLLTTLGIVISVWTIVSVLAVISGMNEYVRDQVITLAPDVLVVQRFGIITSLEEFLEATKRKEITSTEVQRLEDLCRSCDEIGMSINGTRPVHNGRRRIPDVPLVGATANFATLQDIDLEAGRFFTEFEVAHARPVAVIGSEIREELFPHVDPLGRNIWVGRIEHQVIGVRTKQGTVLGQNQDVVTYVPLRMAEKQFGSIRGRRLDVNVQVFVRALGGVAQLEQCQEEIVQIFRWLRHIPFRGPDPIGVVTAEMAKTLWRQISGLTFIVISGMAVVSLFVGAIVVANIMIVSVIERTHEIGLRLALGARKRDIRRQFLIEAMLLSFAGGVIGATLGWGTAWLIDQNAPVPAEAGVGHIAGAMLVASLAGLIAGFFPARQAANLAPIDALRQE